MKGIIDNLPIIFKPIMEHDHVLQLGGLCLDYNSLVASITTWDNEISLDLIHNMLLMHEKRLEQQNLVEENIVVLVNLVST